MENNTYLLKFLEGFNAKEAKKFFDASYLERGMLHARIGNVKSILRHTPFEITAHVRDLKNFRTTVKVDRQGKHFTTLCSCPVNPGCEHGAALAIITASIVNNKNRESYNIPVPPGLYVGLETTFEPGPGMIQVEPKTRKAKDEADIVIKYDADLGHFAREPVYYLGSAAALRPHRLTFEAITELTKKNKAVPLKTALQTYDALTAEQRARQNKNIVTVWPEALNVRFRVTAHRVKLEYTLGKETIPAERLTTLTVQKDKELIPEYYLINKWYWLLDKKIGRLYAAKLPFSPVESETGQLNIEFLFEKLRMNFDDPRISWDVPVEAEEVSCKEVRPVLDVRRSEQTVYLNYQAKKEAEAREMTKAFRRMKDQILDIFMNHPTRKKSALLGELVFGTYPEQIKENTDNVLEDWITDILNANDEFFRIQLPQGWQTKLRRWVKDNLLKGQASLVIVDQKPTNDPAKPFEISKVMILKLPQLEIFEAGCRFFKALFQSRQVILRPGFNIDADEAKFTYGEFQTFKELILLPWLRENKGGVRIDNRGASLPGDIKSKVSFKPESGGWFETNLTVSFADRAINQQDLQKIRTEADGLLDVPGSGEFIVFAEDELKRIRKMASLPSKLKKYQIGEAMHVDDNVVVEDLPGWISKLVETIKDGAKVKPLNIPLFKGELRPYQKQGTLWLKLLYENDLGGVLCDDMGLGKTVQVLAFLSNLQTEEKLGKTLIVCPTSLLWNWANEAAKFSPDLPVHVFHGSPRSLPEDMSKDVLVVTSYGLVRSDERLREINWDHMILDEAHLVKQRSSLVHQALCSVNAKFRAGLTGTPVENHPAEFGNLFNLILPGIFNSDEQDVDVLRRRSRLFLLRRTKEDHLKELPQKTITEVFLDPGTKQRQLYQKTAQEASDQIEKSIKVQGWEKSQLNVLTALMRLRQICGSARLVDPELPCDSGKMEWLKEFLPQLIEENHSVLVFSQFTKLLDEVEDWLDDEELPFKRLDGSTSAIKRRKAVAEFGQDKAEVFLLSLKAGGVGLNLTQASYVVILDPWWNPAVEAQAIDRAHRMGQQKPVTVYRPIIRGSLEERILRLQNQKKELFKTLVGPESDVVLEKLKPEDVFELLK